MSTAVASHSQRNLATLPGHLIFIPVFKVFNRLAKASGFCLYFFDFVMLKHFNKPWKTLKNLRHAEHGEASRAEHPWILRGFASQNDVMKILSQAATSTL